MHNKAQLTGNVIRMILKFTFQQKFTVYSIAYGKKNEKCTILIPKGNSYYRYKSSARGPRFKVSLEGISVEIDILIWSPIQVQTWVDVA